MKGITREALSDFIESLGLPCAYDQFDDDTPQEPPFICWLLTTNSDVMADDENYVDKELLSIELYTVIRDFDLEKSIEDKLKAAGLTYYKEASRIDSEKMYQIAYESEVIINEPEQ